MPPTNAECPLCGAAVLGDECFCDGETVVDPWLVAVLSVCLKAGNRIKPLFEGESTNFYCARSLGELKKIIPPDVRYSRIIFLISGVGRKLGTFMDVMRFEANELVDMYQEISWEDPQWQ